MYGGGGWGRFGSSPADISSYSLPSYVYRWHAHSRAVVFHTLHRGQIDTRLCPLISHRSLRCTLTFALSRESLFTSLRHSSPPSPSAVAAAAYRAPSRSITTSSHHRIPTRAPGALYDPSHRSNSDCVAMYCATVFFRRLMYSSIVKNPRLLPCRRRRGVSTLTARCPPRELSRQPSLYLVMKPPRDLSMGGGDQPGLRSK